MAELAKSRVRPRFRDAVAIVTGGGRGIGKAIALGLAAEGAHVVLCARTAEQVNAVAAEIAAQGQSAVAVPGDVREPDDVARVVATAMATRSGIDVLVNCAGVFRMGPSVETALAELHEVLDINLVGTFGMCQAVGHEMLGAGAGKIINFASLLSFTAFPERAAYAASKGGVLQMTRVLGIEWAEGGVNVNAIAPGMIEIETPHPGVSSGAVSMEAIRQRVPAKRRGRPADIVGPVLFLASSDADYINGQTLVVDGGWLSYGYL